MDATATDVEAALRRWQEVTAPLDHARVEKDATMLARSLKSLLSARADSPVSISDMTKKKDTARPWSHADFLRRVASFGVATWFAKPRSISPLVCARYGWVNTASDLLQCQHCERILCFKIEATLSARGADAVAARFATQLETEHDMTCPWSRNASPVSFTMLPLLGPVQVAEALWERTEKLLTIASTHNSVRHALSEVQVDKKTVTQVLDSAGVDEQTLTKLLDERQAKSTSMATTMDKSIVLTATIISACGWIAPENLPSDAASLVVSCAYCNRHIPLSAAPKEPSQPVEDEEEKSEDTEPQAKRPRIAPVERRVFDPIASHRWFCPWVVKQQDQNRLHETMTSVATDESLVAFVELPGWKQCAQTLHHLGTSRTSTTPSSHMTPLDALASVQSVLALPEAYN